MKLVIVLFSIVIYPSRFTPGVVGNDVTKPQSTSHDLETTTATEPRHILNTTVPKGSKSSSNEVTKTKFKPVPGAADTFRTLRLAGCTFVDKTNFIRQLIDKRPPPQVYLFTRPRRFGKSTFLSMLEDFLEGKVGHFNHTEIQSRGNNIEEDGNWKPDPVIPVDFYGMREGPKAKEFIVNLRSRLKRIAVVNGLSKYRRTWTISDLIEEMERKYGLPVSILIDNYDDPLMQSYTDKAQNELVMGQLTSFYSQIKTCAAKLRLVFIMGVSRLNKIHHA